MLREKNENKQDGAGVGQFVKTNSVDKRNQTEPHNIRACEELNKMRW